MKKRMAGLLIVALCAQTAQAASSKSTTPISDVLNRYRSTLLKRRVPDPEYIQKLRETLTPEGTWPDIDYSDQTRGSWKTVRHLGFVQALLLVYAREDHKLRGNSKLLSQALQALDHWLKKRYKNPNWWHNRINVPKMTAKIAVLLGDKLVNPRRKQVIEIIAQGQLGQTGANLMDNAEIAIIRGCLTNNAGLVKRASTAIATEIKVGSPEGIQKDWGFYQHGPCSQPLSYGRVYLEVICRMGWILRGTPYEIPKAKRKIVSSFFLKGIQWMCRGTYTSPSTMDRQSSRPGALRSSSDFRGMLRKWIETDPEHAAALNGFLARQEGKGEALVGFKHFSSSDLTIYHREGFTFFLKTRSNRTRPTEDFNGENLKGRSVLHSGDHYLLQDGREYFNLPPVWDWQRLPGLTMCDKSGDLKPAIFVGGLGNGLSGLAAMDYRRAFSLRKMWGFHGDAVVCLIGGWQNLKGKKNLRTTIEQCRLKEPVYAGDMQMSKRLQKGRHNSGNYSWAFHNGVGYVPLASSKMSIRFGEVKGSWHAINHNYSKKVIEDRIFLCELEHGESPSPGGYLIVPVTTPEKLRRLIQNPACTMVQNSSGCQSVCFDGKLFMAAFYRPGGVRHKDKLLVSADKPCLAMWTEEYLLLCDPTNKGLTVSVTWGGAERAVKLPSGGRVVRVTPTGAE